MKENCCCKKKIRDEEQYKELIHRINRIEGQVRGIKKMIEEDAYCTDIVVQVMAINAALNSFNKQLLERHIKECVVTDIQNGDLSTIDNLVETLQKVMK